MESVSNTGTYVTSEELGRIQEMNNEFSRAKIALGEIELQKQSILKHVDEIKSVFMQHEKMLIEKYGQDAVINIKTGEVTKNKSDSNT